MTERWLPVVGYEGYYEVSDQGRVRSLTRREPAGWGSTRLRQGRILKPKRAGIYAKVDVGVPGERRTRAIHSLVMEAFIGPRPDGLEVCHNNGEHRDNRLTNLRYDTHKANQQDMVRHGRNYLGSRTHCGHGHEYTPENTRIRENGSRRCRTCDHERTLRRTREGAWRTR